MNVDRKNGGGRGGFGGVVDETNTTDSFALANSTASTINFKDDMFFLGSKEERRRGPKDRSKSTYESRISMFRFRLRNADR